MDETAQFVLPSLNRLSLFFQLAMLEPNVGACVWMCSTRVGKGALGVVCVTLRKRLNIALFSKLNPQPFHRRSSTVIKDKLEN